MSSNFRGFTCWDADRVENVTDPIALNIAPSTFAAVHTPLQLRIRRGTSGESFSPYSEGDLLEDLQDESTNHQFILVKGAAGSGKSHLIRWASTQISSDDSRHVVLVPRAQTNLRGMISLLLEGFEGDEKFDPYREALKGARSTPTVEAGRDQLLSQLAHAIEHNYVPGDQANEEYDKHAADCLPDLLYEPDFRKHYWLTEDGVIARLYDRAFGKSEKGVGKGKKQRFEEQDLPLDLEGAVLEGNQKVLGFYDLLQTNNKVREAAVRVLNRHLSIAVQQMLNFTGQDLLDLFLDIREELYERGQELVLLIEDVARQQGLSGAILEALIVGPNEIDSRSLCRVRSLVGITPDPFSLLPENITQKTTSVVSLDQSGPVDLEEAVLPMAARYLNAVRVPQEELREWYESEEDDPPPNACTDCPFKSKCHDAFGEVNGVGLYPFNEEALTQMYRRKDSGGFTPRVLLRDVLNWPLKSGVEMIEDSRFPSPSLHEEFGGTKGWPADELDKVRNMSDPERRVPLLDLWSKNRKAENLKDGIHEAFDIDKAEIAVVEDKSRKPDTSSGETDSPTTKRREGEREGRSEESDSSRTSKKKSESTNSRPAPSSSKEDSPTHPKDVLGETDQSVWASFDDWANEGVLDMSIVNNVRKRLRSALYHYIDWDGERLLRSSLYGNRVFENESINFEGQAASLGNAEVVVELPVSSQTRTSVATGLQALLLYEHHGHWRFEGAEDRLIKYASLLERTAEAVIDQLRHPPGPDTRWNPGVTAAEVLRLGARAAGKPAASQTTLPDRLDALFQDFPSEDEIPSSVSREWRNLMEEFTSSQEKLNELVKAYNICPKGGQSSNLLLDSANILPILNRIDLSPRTDLPVDTGDLPKRLRFLHQFVRDPDDLLLTPVQREGERWAGWLEKVRAKVGSPDFLEETLETVENTVSALEEVAAIRVPNSKVNDLREKCKQIDASQYGHLWNRAQTIHNKDSSDNLSSRLREIGYINRPHLSQTHDAVRDLVTLADEVLSTSEEWMQDRLDETKHGEERLKKILGRFTETLYALVSKVRQKHSGNSSNSDSNVPNGPLESVEPSDIVSLPERSEEDYISDGEIPTLIRRSRKINDLIGRFKVSREQGKYTKDLSRLQKEYEPILDRLNRLEKAEEALHSCGVDIETFEIDGSIAENAKNQYTLFVEDIGNYLSSENNEMRNVFSKRIDNVIKSQEERLLLIWKNHLENKIIPSYNKNILDIFEDVPEFKDEVYYLKREIEKVVSFKDELPTNETIEDANRISKNIEKRLSQIFGDIRTDDQMLPDDVVAFIEQASSGKASLDSLSDEVEGYLEDLGIKDAFVITVTPNISGQ